MFSYVDFNIDDAINEMFEYVDVNIMTSQRDIF